jgi:elongation factor P
MIQAGDLRPGIKLIYNNEPYVVIDVTFVKPGKGGAFARTKVKNLLNNLQREVTWRNEEKLEQPNMSYRKVQFLYNNDREYTFMDQESFEDITILKTLLTSILPFIKEQEFYTVVSWNDSIIDVQPPLHMSMTVVDTPPGVKGDTAQGGGGKSAICDTGLTLVVPLFIAIGDVIKVDTRTSEYIERIKK